MPQYGKGIGRTAVDGAPLQAHPRYLDTGETLLSREVRTENAVQLVTQVLYLSYFHSLKTEATNSATYMSQTTAAAATPTRVQFGLWTADADGSLTALVASTANDTSLFAAANTAYTKAYSAAYTRTAGTFYASGVLVVSGAACPTLSGVIISGLSTADAEYALAPRRVATVAAQATLPSTVAVGSLTAVRAAPYVRLA